MDAHDNKIKMINISLYMMEMAPYDFSERKAISYILHLCERYLIIELKKA